MRIQVTGEALTDEIEVSTGQQARTVMVSAGLVSSVNGQTGDIAGLARAEDVPVVADAAAATAVAGHVAAVDPHKDREWADTKFLPNTGGTVTGSLTATGGLRVNTPSQDVNSLIMDAPAGSTARIAVFRVGGDDKFSLGPAGDLRIYGALDTTGQVAIRDRATDADSMSGGTVVYSKAGKGYLKQADGSIVQLGIVTASKSAVFPTPAGAVSYAVWRAPKACTVTAVRGYRVGGTGATINASRNALALAATDLSLSTADTWLSAPSLQNTAMAAGDTLTLRITGVTGSPTAVTIQVDTQG